MGNRNNNKIYAPCWVGRAVFLYKNSVLMNFAMEKEAMLCSNLPWENSIFLRILKTIITWSPVIEPRKTKRRLCYLLPSKHRVISEKGEKRNRILTVLFRTSMLGNFLLMYLRDDSMGFSSKKGGLDLGSEQVCTEKPHYISTLPLPPINISLPSSFILTKISLRERKSGDSLQKLKSRSGTS